MLLRISPVARINEGSMALVLDWRSSLDEHGFAITPGVFGDAEMTALARQLEQCSLRRSRAGVRHALQLQPVCTIARAPGLLAIAREVLGQDCLPFRATLFEKSPKTNWLVVWHQDTALPLRERKEAPGWGPWSVKDGVTYAHAPVAALDRVLALRVHLDDSTRQNGPLRVLPGTHTLGVLEDDAIRDVAGKIAPVECEARRGSVLAMRPLLVHASSKSKSDLPRRVLHIEYAATPHIAEGLEIAVT